MEIKKTYAQGITESKIIWEPPVVDEQSAFVHYV